MKVEIETSSDLFIEIVFIYLCLSTWVRFVMDVLVKLTCTAVISLQRCGVKVDGPQLSSFFFLLPFGSIRRPRVALVNEIVHYSHVRVHL